jgi:hypothetical protein
VAALLDPVYKKTTFFASEELKVRAKQAFRNYYHDLRDHDQGTGIKIDDGFIYVDDEESGSEEGLLFEILEQLTLRSLPHPKTIILQLILIPTSLLDPFHKKMKFVSEEWKSNA